MLNTKTMKTYCLAIGLLVALLPGCTSEEPGGFASLATVDPQTILNDIEPTLDPFNNGSRLPGELTGDNVGNDPSDQIIFSRRGLDDIVGVNRLTWVYSSGDVPTLQEDYTIAASDILFDNEQNIWNAIKLLDTTGGVLLAFYLEDRNATEYGTHFFARGYADGGIVIHVIPTKGSPNALGVFIYCEPGSDVESCAGSILSDYDGLTEFQHFGSSASTNLDAEAVTDETLVSNWMQAAGQVNADNAAVTSHSASQ